MKRLVLAFGIVGVCSLGPFETALATSRGAVVVSVKEGGSASRAGIARGDVISAWSGPGCEGRCPIGSSFDLLDAQDQGARGPVTLLGESGGRKRVWSVAPGRWHLWFGVNDWQLEARPLLSPGLTAVFDEADPLLRESHLLQSAQVRDDGRVRAIGLEIAGHFCREAERAERAGEVEAARFFRVWAARWVTDWPQDRSALYQLAIDGASRRQEARFLAERSAASFGLGDWSAGEAGFERALALYQEIEPEGVGAARCLRALGILEAGRVAPAASQAHFREALAIYERLAPDSLAVAATLTDFAMTVVRYGDLELAERLASRARVILERLAPESDYGVLNGFVLARVQADRGDLAGAEGNLRGLEAPARRVAELDGWGGLLTDAWNKLGDVVYRQGELGEAEEHYSRALANTRLLRPIDDVLIAISLYRLGGIARERGELAKAQSLLERSLETFERKSAGGLWHVDTLLELADLHGRLGDVQQEEALRRKALALRERTSPRSLEAAESRSGLALMALRAGDLSSAEDECRQALEIQERSAPESAALASTLYRLGLVLRRGGQRERAADALCRAVEVLERQKARLGGSLVTRATFAARFADLYRDYIEVLLELGRPGDAFQVLERSRARAFLSMLAEREIAFSADIPPSLSMESSRIGREYDRTLKQLETAEETERASLSVRLLELQREAEGVASRIRSVSPRLAALRAPEPYDVARTSASLPPGTILLSYSVGESRSWLFVVTAGRRDVTALPLEVPRERLRGQIDRFRALIERGRSGGEAPVPLVTLGKTLYDELVAPAARLLPSARRILVCPDGPLHQLPFAALVREVTASGEPSYLVERMPLHTVLSASVYGELRKDGRVESTGPRLAAFGDPKSPTLSGAGRMEPPDAELRSAARRGFTLEPLPATRLEVHRIATLYGDRAVAYLGAEATEERAKAVGTDVRLLHFACHALLDEKLPLNSGLVLSAGDPGGENGLLQSWEILNGMRLDADLVTLSACQTAQGRELGGEGLVGLTRAFQYAGARAVLASLWSVGDEPTEELMTRFYTHLKAGEAKDEALRSAQVELLRAPEGRLSHPFAWAAFQLNGDPGTSRP